MASRIGSIIAIAEKKSADILNGMPDGSKAKSNVERINDICRSLLRRGTPLLPTAKLVSEEGRKNNPYFPREQTIFNSYGKVIRIWKKAYYDVMNIDADAPMGEGDVERIDTSLMNPSTGDLVDRLKVIIVELTQRCNGLKQIIDEGVPVRSEGFPEGSDTDEIMMRLRAWLLLLHNSAFQLDEMGLRVSRKTPPGTRIMDDRLFSDLRTFTDDYERIRKAQRASEK